MTSCYLVTPISCPRPPFLAFHYQTFVLCLFLALFTLHPRRFAMWMGNIVRVSKTLQYRIDDTHIHVFVLDSVPQSTLATLTLFTPVVRSVPSGLFPSSPGVVTFLLLRALALALPRTVKPPDLQYPSKPSLPLILIPFKFNITTNCTVLSSLAGLFSLPRCVVPCCWCCWCFCC